MPQPPSRLCVEATKRGVRHEKISHQRLKGLFCLRGDGSSSSNGTTTISSPDAAIDVLYNTICHILLLLCGNSQQHHYGVCRIEVMVLRWVYYGNPWCYIPNTGCCKIAHVISIYDVDYTTLQVFFEFCSSSVYVLASRLNRSCGNCVDSVDCPQMPKCTSAALHG